MTTTPLTDELYLNIQQNDDHEFVFNAMHDHARDLETRLAAAERLTERMEALGKSRIKELRDDMIRGLAAFQAERIGCLRY